jgi:hypothetical protein
MIGRLDEEVIARSQPPARPVSRSLSCPSLLMPSVKVTSLDALRHLRSALVKFAEATGETMIGLDMELRRGLQWLLDEQPKFWKNEERRLHDRVLEARQELSRCRSMALPGEVAPCSEQKHVLERAIAQLRHAEEKSKITKHWGRVIEHEAHEWQGRANRFTNVLEGDLPQAIALLDRAIASLEGYLVVGVNPAGMSERARERESEGLAPQPSSADSLTLPLSHSLTPASTHPTPEAPDASR